EGDGGQERRHQRRARAALPGAGQDRGQEEDIRKAHGDRPENQREDECQGGDQEGDAVAAQKEEWISHGKRSLLHVRGLGRSTSSLKLLPGSRISRKRVQGKNNSQIGGAVPLMKHWRTWLTCYFVRHFAARAQSVRVAQGRTDAV